MSKIHFKSPIEVMEHLSHQSKKGKLILFCGAGVSIKEPSSLPSVDVIVCSVLEKLMETAPELKDDIFNGSYIFRTAPFELFMSVIQQGLLFRVFEVLEPLLGGNPNSIHRYITRLLVERKVMHVITTNFDDMFESALASSLEKVTFYYSWEEVDNLKMNFSHPSIIKPHGSFFDKDGKDITNTTILTTTESIYRYSKEIILKKWAKLLKGFTIVFLGYSGRDRLDVVPILSHLTNSDIIWVCHTNDRNIEIADELSDLLSKEIKTLMKSTIRITPISCHSEKFLAVLGDFLGSIYDEESVEETNSRSNYSISIKRAGFLPPIFPKYSYIVAGYLLWWLGFARQAGYAFSEFHRNCVDEEPRLSSNASSTLGQIFENLGELPNAETSYRIALSGYWGLGDYPSIIKTQCYHADLLIKMENYDEAERLIRDSIVLSEREEYEYGLNLAYYTKAKLCEITGKLSEAFELYSEAIKYAENTGDFWIEAGSRQQLVKVEHMLNGGYSENALEELITALEKVYWIGNGSAPSLKTASLVDPFFLADALIDSLVEIKGKGALPYIDSHKRFDRIAGQLPTDVRIRVKQKLGT